MGRAWLWSNGEIVTEEGEKDRIDDTPFEANLLNEKRIGYSHPDHRL